MNYREVKKVGVLVFAFVFASVFVLMLVLGWFVVCSNGLLESFAQGMLAGPWRPS